MSYDILFQQALIAHQQGRFDEAEQLYRQILETAPEHPDVLNMLGLVAQAKGVHSQAINLFYQAIQKAPQHAPFYFNIALSLEAEGKNIEALDMFLKALEIAPDTKEIHHQMGLLYHKLDRINEARQSFLKAIELDSDYSEAKTNLAMTYLPQDKEKAVKFLEDISVQYPKEALSRYFLSSIYYENHQYEQSLVNAKAAETLVPLSDEVQVILGLLALQTQKTDDAEVYFEAALRINPRNVQAMINLANLQTNRQDFKSAEIYYKKAIELADKNLDARVNYANMLYNANRLSEALEEYRQAVILNPQSAESSNNIGIILKDLKEYEEALGLFFNAYHLNPEIEAFSVNIAETLVLLFRKNKELATKIAENWVKGSPENVFARHVDASFKGESLEDTKVYCQKLFDNFADNYELVLKRVAYSLPSRIRDLAGNVKGTIIDLGCGSGLVGQALKTAENQIIGVDLSKNMLDLAKKKKVYQKLVKGDIVAYMQSRPIADLVVAADVFGYMGDLSPIVKALESYKIIFSIETLKEADKLYQITDSGRFRHNPLYVEKLLAQNGFKSIQQTNIILRQENGHDVEGIIFIAQ